MRRRLPALPRSYRESGWARFSVRHGICGSRLAGEGVRPDASPSAVTPGSPANRLLRIRRAPTIACFVEIPCRSALARERGGSVEIDGTGQFHSRASALLQILCARKIACFAVIYCRSELARDAVGHSTSPFQTHGVRPIAARSKPAPTDSECVDDCLLCRDPL